MAGRVVAILSLKSIYYDGELITYHNEKVSELFTIYFQIMTLAFEMGMLCYTLYIDSLPIIAYGLLISCL